MMKFVLYWLMFVALGAAAQQSETLSIVVKPGENLGLITQRYFKRPAYQHWPEIAKINQLKAPYTLQPGSVLRLPVQLLAASPVAAKWATLTGDIRVYRRDGQVITPAVGDVLAEGERAVIAANSSALLEMADASQMKLMSGSEFVLDQSRYYKGMMTSGLKTDTDERLSGTHAFSGLLRLIQGAIETRATPANDRARPLRIQTPTAVVGVRGTEFRVSHSDATRVEVTQGLVAAQSNALRPSDVGAGFGVKLDAKQALAPAVVPLLDAPDLSSWSLKQDKLTVEFPSLPNLVAGKQVSAYRIHLATDAGMTKISYSKVFTSHEIFRIPDLADGTWYLNVRAIDEQGLEGKDATAILVLKARPQPPFIQTPKPKEKIVQGQDAQFSWAKPSGAHSFVLELQNEKNDIASHTVQDAKLDIKNLAAGTYSWRIATQMKTPQGSFDKGPWSDWQKLTVMAIPEPVQGGIDKEGKALNLRWDDQKAKEYEVQLANESSFDATKSQIVVKTTGRPDISIPDLKSGQYFVRYRAIEADGFVGGWSGTMEVTVPFNWMPVWIFLGWAAIAL
jgi:hypothetical protein